jgi:hypothetical protein
MTTRLGALSKLVAVSLVVLAASPFTVPFATFKLTAPAPPGRRDGVTPGHPDDDAGVAKLKTCGEPLCSVPARLAAIPPLLNTLANHFLQVTGRAEQRRIRFVLRV